MSQQEKLIIDLLERFAAGRATREEAEELFKLLSDLPQEEAVVSFLTGQLDKYQPLPGPDTAYWTSRFAGFTALVTGTPDTASAAASPSVRLAVPDQPSATGSPVTTPSIPAPGNIGRPIRLYGGWWKYAAAILLLFGGGARLYYMSKQKPSLSASRHVPINDVAPGGDRAILTLADGSDIVLDSAVNGQLAQQSGVKVIKTADGQLKYEGQAKGEDDGSAVSGNGAVSYNTMRTPRGGQYRLILPDGTKVWLNAASSITYPTAFAGNERIVKITGEVYFEVAPDKAKAFRAEVNDTRIEVLGTHFNINAYSDESSLKTTLLEGSVRVSHGTDSRVLFPGQQAVVNDRLQVNRNISIDQVMAWKNGLFIFDDKKFGEIMRQLSRWYDIDIVYEKGVPDIELAGEMGRDLNLLQVLDGLKDMNVHYRLEGKKLIVLR